MKLGAVILTGDFVKSSESDAAPCGFSDWRRISPLQAAFSNTNTHGLLPVLRHCGAPVVSFHGGTWPEC